MTESGEDETPRRVSPRFRNLAVRRLGYTQTEAGRRTLRQIDDELEDLVLIEREIRRAEEEAQADREMDLENDGEGED